VTNTAQHFRMVGWGALGEKSRLSAFARRDQLVPERMRGEMSDPGNQSVLAREVGGRDASGIDAIST